jgi:hypothetical protein
VTVAAVAVLMCTSVFTAFAVPRIRTVVARWTDDIFTFDYGGEFPEETPIQALRPPAENGAYYPDLADSLAGYGITMPLAPTWIPEGFEVTEVDVQDKSTFLYMTVLLEKDANNSVIINIEANPNNVGIFYEKDDREVKVYEKEGVTYYIMTNNARINAVWANGEYEGLISVSESVGKDTLYKIINSIYER